MEKNIKIKSRFLAPLNECIKKLNISENAIRNTNPILEADEKYSSIITTDKDITDKDYFNEVEVEEISTEDKNRKEELLNKAKDSIKTVLDTNTTLSDILKEIDDINNSVGTNEWSLNEEGNTAILPAKNLSIFVQNDNLCLSDNGEIKLFPSVDELHMYLNNKNIPLPKDISLTEGTLPYFGKDKYKKAIKNLEDEDKSNLYHPINKYCHKKKMRPIKDHPRYVSPIANINDENNEKELEEFIGTTTGDLGMPVQYLANKQELEEKVSPYASNLGSHSKGEYRDVYYRAKDILSTIANGNVNDMTKTEYKFFENLAQLFTIPNEQWLEKYGKLDYSVVGHPKYAENPEEFTILDAALAEYIGYRVVDDTSKLLKKWVLSVLIAKESGNPKKIEKALDEFNTHFGDKIANYQDFTLPEIETLLKKVTSDSNGQRITTQTDAALLNRKAELYKVCKNEVVKKLSGKTVQQVFAKYDSFLQNSTDENINTVKSKVLAPGAKRTQAQIEALVDSFEKSSKKLYIPHEIVAVKKHISEVLAPGDLNKFNEILRNRKLDKKAKEIAGKDTSDDKMNKAVDNLINEEDDIIKEFKGIIVNFVDNLKLFPSDKPGEDISKLIRGLDNIRNKKDDEPLDSFEREVVTDYVNNLLSMEESVAKTKLETVYESLILEKLNTVYGKLEEDDSPEDFAMDIDSEVSDESSLDSDDTAIDSDIDLTDADDTLDMDTTDDSLVGDFNFSGNSYTNEYSPDEEDSEVEVQPQPEYKIIDILMNDENSDDIKVKLQNIDTGDIEIEELSKINI